MVTYQMDRCPLWVHRVQTWSAARLGYRRASLHAESGQRGWQSAGTGQGNSVRRTSDLLLRPSREKYEGAEAIASCGHRSWTICRACIVSRPRAQEAENAGSWEGRFGRIRGTL